jgi:hypothetical protein
VLVERQDKTQPPAVTYLYVGLAAWYCGEAPPGWYGDCSPIAGLLGLYCGLAAPGLNAGDDGEYEAPGLATWNAGLAAGLA